ALPSILRAVPAGASPTTPGRGPESSCSRLPPRPAEATILWQTGVAARGPLPDRVARGHRVPWESGGPSGRMAALAASGRAAGAEEDVRGFDVARNQAA